MVDDAEVDRVQDSHGSVCAVQWTFEAVSFGDLLGEVKGIFVGDPSRVN
jgi:hypothetical protein